MDQILQSTATIRDRGQLTIPDFIREAVGWVSPGSVVSISQIKDDQIVIKPHAAAGSTSWNKLWRNIELARSYKGKYRGSLSEFIVSDREDRR